MTYACCDQNRRDLVAADPSLNGIDYVEVLDRDAPSGIPRQQTLLVRCLKAVPKLNPENIRITGGVRIRAVKAQWVASADAVPEVSEQAFFSAMEDPDKLLVIRTDSSGDFSRYTLRLVKSASDPLPFPGFDVPMASAEFSFKVECASDFDCSATAQCPAPESESPDIDYLAKDYTSFRRLILDRISQLVPGWRERSAADLIVTLSELLAHVGDHLSYQQDAIATEAYVGTARSRVSLRRHALLVDYRIGEGSNARAWVVVQVGAAADGRVLEQDETVFLTRVDDASPVLTSGSPELDEMLPRSPEWFEPLHDLTLHSAHARMSFYTWGDERCCLPSGSTFATLKGHFP